MTERTDMGESRGGEGSGRQVATSDILRALAERQGDDQVHPDRILILRATPLLYAVQIHEVGVEDPEAFFLGFEEGEGSIGAS